MANVTRVRVVSTRPLHNMSREEKMDAVRKLVMEFRGACQDFGLIQEIKKHQYFVTPSEKERTKRKQALRQRKFAEMAAEKEKLDIKKKHKKEATNRRK